MKKIIQDNSIEFISIKEMDIVGKISQKDINVQSCADYYLSSIEKEAFCYFQDPFRSLPTLNIFVKSKSLEIAESANKILQKKGIDASIAASLEFFVFDKYEYITSAFFQSLKLHDEGFPSTVHTNSTSQNDLLSNINAEIISNLQQIGVKTKFHYCLPNTSQNISKCIIELLDTDIVTICNNIIIAKYIIRNVVASYGKYASFMPLPIKEVDCNMPAHLVVGGVNLISFSESINKNIDFINGFIYIATNSYKKLLNLNKLCIIKDNKIFFKSLDMIGNPYLIFSCLLLTGTAENIDNPHLANSDANCKQSDLNISLEKIETGNSYFKQFLGEELLKKYLTAVKQLQKEVNLYPSPAEFKTYSEL